MLLCLISMLREFLRSVFGVETRPQRNSPKAKKRVVILGGGVSAVTVAMQLTDNPNWREQFESITIYQLGWRLGGKGATGRASDAGRILEHGLHVWLGYYENAFRLIKNVYAAAGRPAGSPIRTWNDAFTGQNDVGIMEHHHGVWSPWLFHIDPNNEVPGQGSVPPLPVCIERSIRFIGDRWDQFERAVPNFKPQMKLGAKLAELAPNLDDETKVEETIHKLRELIELTQNSRKRIISLNSDERRVLMLIEMGATILYGVLSENIRSYADLEKLERVDFAQWLRNYNGDPWLSDLSENPLLRGMYDFAFAYQDGHSRRPNFAAAPALRTIFRMCLTFKGSIFYKMNAGMGDTIFAPAYEALRNRGVEIQFFHKVKRLELSSDKKRVARICMGRQVTLKTDVYQPFVQVVVDKGSIPLPCWPDRPCYDQLVEGEALRESNADLESFWTTWSDVEEVTIDSDKEVVVFGISLGSVPYLCKELVTASDKWAKMARNVRTVRTQSLQLWLGPDIRHLGWREASPMLDAWVDPLNTWADMTSIMSFESWGADKPGSLAYFCGPMVGGIPDQNETGFPARAKQEVEATAASMLQRDIQTLWHSVPPNGLPLGDVVAKHVRANVDPSERYVLSLANSAKYRLPANGSGFSNLVITGDWIKNGYNAGCVEAAVWSGIQAANTILGRPINQGVIAG